MMLTVAFEGHSIITYSDRDEHNGLSLTIMVDDGELVGTGVTLCFGPDDRDGARATLSVLMAALQDQVTNLGE